MLEILLFLSIKTASAIKFDKVIGFYESFLVEKMPNGRIQDFICKIQFGDILRNAGDILLCPVSEGFRPSNPLSRKIIEKEGKWLTKEIESLYSSDTPKWIGSEHVAFLPCRKLKYRGILFVSVDFYSDNRDNINASRIAEALEIAYKYNCKKLTCPQNLLYSPENDEFSYKFSFDYIYHEWNRIVLALKDKVKIDFIIENLVQKNLLSLRMFMSSLIPYDFSNSLIEYLPDCAQILPHYRRKLRSIRTPYTFSDRTAKEIRKLLTSPINDRKALRLFKKLLRIMDLYEESGVGRCNEGFEFFILGLCNEMPWNFLQLKELFENLPEDKYGSFDDFIFKERFRDLSKFEYRCISRKN